MTSFSQDHADVNVINSCYDTQKHKNTNMGKKNLKQIILFLSNLWHKFLLSNKKIISLVYAYYGNGGVFDTLTANLSKKRYSFKKLIPCLTL